MPYPTCRYHRTLPMRIVRTPGEDEALGPEWADTPAAFEDAGAAAAESHASVGTGTGTVVPDTFDTDLETAVETDPGTDKAPKKRGRKPSAE